MVFRQTRRLNLNLMLLCCWQQDANTSKIGEKGQQNVRMCISTKSE